MNAYTYLNILHKIGNHTLIDQNMDFYSDNTQMHCKSKSPVEW